LHNALAAKGDGEVADLKQGHDGPPRIRAE